MPQLEIYDRTLANGLRVILCPDTGAPVVSVNVTYHVGSINEHRGKTGLAHLFEHLMFDNTTTGVDKQYDKCCTRAGGSNNAYTTYDHTTYYINLPKHQLELGLWLEAQRMAGFAISDHALLTQRNVVIEEIKQNLENQPYMKWNPAMDAAAYDAHSSYSWNVYGSPMDVASVGMSDVHDFYDRYYHTKNAVLVVAGDIEIDKAFASIEEIFGGIESRTVAPQPVVFKESFRRTGTHVIEPDDVPFPAVFVAYHLPGTTDDTMFDIDLVSGFLGSGKRAVLYRDLVAGSRLASAAGCFIDRRTHSSLLIAYAYARDVSVRPNALAEAIQQSLINAKVIQQDRDRMVNHMRTSIAAETQRVGGIASALAWATTFFDDPNHVNKTMDLYSARTTESMQAILERTKDVTQSVRVDVVPHV